MNALNPKLAEFLKRVSKPGEEAELEKETEWAYVCKVGIGENPEAGFTVSKFLVDEGFWVSATAIHQRWPKMNQSERLDFVSNWWCKDSWTDNDTEILEIIMRDGDDLVWHSCTQAFLKHPDRDRAVSFLIERLQKNELGHEPLNYIQVLGMSKDHRAKAAITPYYEKYRAGMEAEAVTGVPDNIFFGPIPYHAYFVASSALLKIEGKQEYEQAIRKYLEHPNEQVRWWAENALGIEGPTTAKRNAEYRKKYAKK